MELNIKEIDFDENIDFTNECYELDADFNNNYNIYYFDNMESIPKYKNDTIYYKTINPIMKFI